VEIFPHRLLFAAGKVRLAQLHKVLGEQKLVVHIFPKMIIKNGITV
jgi:methyl coenzyme M reductase subunit D